MRIAAGNGNRMLGVKGVKTLFRVRSSGSVVSSRRARTVRVCFRRGSARWQASLSSRARAFTRSR